MCVLTLRGDACAQSTSVKIEVGLLFVRLGGVMMEVGVYEHIADKQTRKQDTCQPDAVG